MLQYPVLRNFHAILEKAPKTRFDDVIIRVINFARRRPVILRKYAGQSNGFNTSIKRWV